MLLFFALLPSILVILFIIDQCRIDEDIMAIVIAIILFIIFMAYVAWSLTYLFNYFGV